MNSYFKFKRQPFKNLSLSRLIRGGRLTDAGRLIRYAPVIAAGLAFCWLPAIGYIKFSKPSYVSHFSMILPGAGASSSLNLTDIGQASSASSSAYSSSSISPTVTYKNFLMSANVIEAAAYKLKVDPASIPDPTIKLVDETSFIMVTMSGASAEEARNRADAMQSAFFSELSKLRDDEIRRREDSATEPVRLYEKEVDRVRKAIADLQAKSGLHSVEQFNTLVSNTDLLQSHVSETQAALAQQEQSAAALAATLKLSPKQAAIAMKLHADPQFSALAEATSKAQSDFAEAGRQYGAEHPKVVEARSRYQGAQSQMMARAARLTGLKPAQLTAKIDLAPTGQRSALMSQLVTLETERMGLAAKLDTEQADLLNRRKRIDGLANTAAELDSLDRDFKVAEAVFASALARMSTTKTDVFASYPMVQTVEAPVKPLKPSSPNKKLAIASAVAASFLLIFSLLLGWLRKPVIDKLLAKRHGGE